MAMIVICIAHNIYHFNQFLLRATDAYAERKGAPNKNMIVNHETSVNNAKNGKFKSIH